ncbi:MAG: hypothetical protein JXA50_09010 [Deltaproteobacteria bacterium]|nr:hypothetical protein [Deltaproteobacteria bacterium]
MKKTIILCLVLVLSGAALALTVGKSVQSDDSVQVFWQKFKTAVIKGNKEAVVTLSQFPIEMPYGVASIENEDQLLGRYRELFNVQTNAALCFAKAKPEMDAEDPKQFAVACPDAAGNLVVIYYFEQTKAGWKFVALDNINE